MSFRFCPYSFFAVSATTCLLLAAGCVTLGGRLATAHDFNSVAQAAAVHYTKDRGEATCVVAVARSGSSTVFAGAGGADEHSVYRIASLTKLFLLPVFRRLHDAGRLNLDLPVTAYSKLSLPPEYRAVTLRDLLANRSGLPREFDSWPLLFSALSSGLVGTHVYADFESREAFVANLWKPQWREAVRNHVPTYSNMGFGLLGVTVEDALGTSLDTLLEEELLQPLALTDTSFRPTVAQTAHLTVPRAGSLPWLFFRGTPVPDHRLGPLLRATGGLFSSASDCVKVFNLYWRVLDEQVRLHPLDACRDGDIYGVLRVRQMPDGHKVLYRAGMYYGGASFVCFDLQTRTLVVILRNVTEWPDLSGFEVLNAVNQIETGETRFRTPSDRLP